VTAIVIEALAELLATLVAAIVCAPAVVELDGVYKPLALIVPAAVLPPFVPSTDHVTPRFCESPVTVAVSCAGCDVVTAARLGLTLTLMAPATRVVAVATLEKLLRFPNASVAATM
jgi:hypothetical protein